MKLKIINYIAYQQGYQISMFKLDYMGIKS